MRSGFLAALTRCGEVKERLHRACAGDARGWLYSIEEYAFVGRESDNDIGTADNWLQSQALLQVLQLRWFAKEVLDSGATVRRQPVRGGK